MESRTRPKMRRKEDCEMNEKAFTSVASYFEEYNSLKAFHICFLLETIREQQEKIERYEKALNWIVDNFDSKKSGLTDTEYHQRMMKIAKEALGKGGR